MLNVLIQLAQAASAMGKVTSAFMYDSGLITIDGNTHDGADFSITYRLKDENEAEDVDNT